MSIASERYRRAYPVWVGSTTTVTGSYSLMALATVDQAVRACSCSVSVSPSE